MIRVRRVNGGEDAPNGSWVRLRLPNGETFVMDNCQLIPQVYWGNAHVKDENGEDKIVTTKLFIYGDDEMEIDL